MSTLRDLAVAEARLWLGTPYRHQSSVRGAGCDCLGLIRAVWRRLYGAERFAVPPYSSNPRRALAGDDLAEAARTWLRPVDGAERAPGDVLLFRLHRSRTPGHCGILTGTGTFIHSQERLGVVEAPLGGAWQRRIAGVFAFPPGAATDQDS